MASSQTLSFDISYSSAESMRVTRTSATSIVTTITTTAATWTGFCVTHSFHCVPGVLSYLLVTVCASVIALLLWSEKNGRTTRKPPARVVGR